MQKISPRSCIQALKPYVPGRSIEDIEAAYHPPQITKLGSNENPLGANPNVIAAVQAVLPKMYLYPDGGSRNLRHTLAEFYKVKSEEILIGNGSDEVLLMIAAAFLNPGEKVLVSENTFSEYEFSGRLFDGEIVKIPLKNYRYDISAFIEKLSLKPKLIFLCNPNNPTGSYITHQELEALLKVTAPETLVVVDEAYAEYSTATDFPNCLELRKTYPQLLISRTFSKIYALAALRLGYIIAQPEIILEMSRTKTPFNANLLAQVAAQTALEDRAFVNKSLVTNETGKAFLTKTFSDLGLRYINTEANFICFESKRLALELCEDLARQGIIIRALKSFGLDYWNRVTIGTEEQNQRFVAALKTVI